MGMHTPQDLAVQLWAIGDEVRLRIIEELPKSDDCANKVNVTTLSERLSMSQPTISHHLRVLRQAGIVKKSKRCRDCFYYMDTESSLEVVEKLRSLVIGE